jgi:hypothetical protein
MWNEGSEWLLWLEKVHLSLLRLELLALQHIAKASIGLLSITHPLTDVFDKMPKQDLLPCPQLN